MGEVESPATGSVTARIPAFFFSEMFTEPHSTKPIEDGIGWGLETDPARHRAREWTRPG